MPTLSNLDATAQAELVRRKEISAAELVDAAIRRIEAHDGALNAVIMKRFDEARAEAKAHDAKPSDAPFRGVPIVVKDIIAQVAGMPYTAGTRPLKDAGFVSRHDSYLVASLKQAGFVIVGKTNTSELGILPSAEPSAWGSTRNPYDPTRSTGGSSGGTGAAVAAGLVPVGHGNDGGGSIRIPSSACGLVGLKPSRGRNSLGPDLGEINGGLVAEHVLARSVRDSAAILDRTHGYRPGDPYVAPTPARPYLDEVGAKVERLRVRFYTKYITPMGTLADSHPDVVAGVQKAAKLLADLGHDVAEGEIAALQHKEWVARFLAVWASGVSVDLENIAAITGKPVTADDVEPLTWALANMGRAVSGPAYALGWQFLRARAREVGQWFQQHDLWLTPTITQPPPPLGSYASTPQDPMSAIFKAAELAPFTAPINATGQPAISLPLHQTAEGLPIGVQLVGDYGREDLLLRVAAQLEAAAPWKHGATRADA
jgi:amidase